MENSTPTKKKKSFFESPLLSSKVKSANVKIFPEGGLGFFIGPTLALLANSILGQYFNMYMTNVLNITAWASTFFTWLPVISVIFVVAGNIVVGRLMDKSRTKAGKARPLLLVSVPLSILALLILFIISPFATDTLNTNSQMIALVCIAIGYNLWFAIAYPFYYTSHAALVNLSTRNSKGRSLLATISNATSLAAMGLCSMILPFFLSLLFVYQTDPALVPAGSIPTMENGVIKFFTDPTGAVVYDQVASYNHWKIFVIALMIITALGALIEYYFTRERITEESFNTPLASTEKKKSVPVGKQAKVCFKDKFWWIMIAFFFLYQLGGMMKNTSQLYFCQAMFDENGVYSTAIGGGFSGTLAIVGAIPTAIGMVIAWPLSNKIGKGKAILFGAILSVAGGAIGFIDPTNFYLVVTSFVIKALGSTPAMYLSLALLADMLDHQEAMHGFRTDGFTMTIYGAIMAGMTGIATGILNAVLSALDYSATNVSSETIRVAMPWIFIGGETICYGVIAIIFIFMGVEKFSKFDHAAIVKDQRAKALAEGVEYVDPAVKLKLEEAEADAQADEARKEELRKRCAKAGLDFEAEEAKYQAVQAEKQKAADAKKAAADAKKAEAEKAKQAKYDALSEAEKAKAEAQKEAKAKKQAEREAEALKAFNKLRSDRSLTTLDESDFEQAPNETPTPQAPEAVQTDEPTTEQDGKTDESTPADSDNE